MSEAMDKPEFIMPGQTPGQRIDWTPGKILPPILDPAFPEHDLPDHAPKFLERFFHTTEVRARVRDLTQRQQYISELAKTVLDITTIYNGHDDDTNRLVMDGFGTFEYLTRLVRGELPTLKQDAAAFQETFMQPGDEVDMELAAGFQNWPISHPNTCAVLDRPDLSEREQSLHRVGAYIAYRLEVPLSPGRKSGYTEFDIRELTGEE